MAFHLSPSLCDTFVVSVCTMCDAVPTLRVPNTSHPLKATHKNECYAIVS